MSDREQYSEPFRRWLVMGDEGSVQRERYDRAVAAWDAGASEGEVAAILGIKRAGDAKDTA